MASEVERIVERADSFPGLCSWFKMWEKLMRSDLKVLGCPHYDEQEYQVA